MGGCCGKLRSKFGKKKKVEGKRIEPAAKEEAKKEAKEEAKGETKQDEAMTESGVPSQQSDKVDRPTFHTQQTAENYMVWTPDMDSASQGQAAVVPTPDQKATPDLPEKTALPNQTAFPDKTAMTELPEKTAIPAKPDLTSSASDSASSVGTKPTA